MWIRIQGYVINSYREKECSLTKIYLFNYEEIMALNDMFFQLSLWMVMFCPQSDTFYLLFIIYLFPRRSWIWIRIHNTQPGHLILTVWPTWHSGRLGWMAGGSARWERTWWSAGWCVCSSPRCPRAASGAAGWTGTRTRRCATSVAGTCHKKKVQSKIN